MLSSVTATHGAVGPRPMVAAPTARFSRRAASRVRAKHEKSETITGVVFQPYQEVASVLKSTSSTDVAKDARASLARHPTYTPSLEAAVNEQINVEYNISYVYHSLSAYFARDSVALPGIASYFGANSLEERSHAQKLIDFQTTRGGRVVLKTLAAPPTELEHSPERGDALHAFELALSLEKLNYGKLLELHHAASDHGDPQATQFVEEMLDEQVADVKKASDYVTQLRRIGTGHAVWAFDNELSS